MTEQIGESGMVSGSFPATASLLVVGLAGVLTLSVHMVG
jgi:hypothetical protein